VPAAVVISKSAYLLFSVLVVGRINIFVTIGRTGAGYFLAKPSLPVMPNLPNGRYEIVCP
jgi:hypothetical protein